MAPARLPNGTSFIPHNFNPSSWEQYEHIRRIDVLKMDCEGCEHTSLLPFLDRVCVDVLMLEFHSGSSTPNTSAPARSSWTVERQLVVRLAAALSLKYQMYYAEDNPFCTTQRCIEVAMRRKEPCGETAATHASPPSIHSSQRQLR